MIGQNVRYIFVVVKESNGIVIPKRKLAEIPVGKIKDRDSTTMSANGDVRNGISRIIIILLKNNCYRIYTLRFLGSGHGALF